MCVLLLLLCACAGQDTQMTEPTMTESKESSSTVHTVATESTTEPSVDEVIMTEPVSGISGSFLEESLVAAVEEQYQSAHIAVPGSVISFDGNISVILETAYLCKDVRPDNTEGAYSYLEENEGCNYLVCRGTIENLGNAELSYNAFAIGHNSPFGLFARYGDKWYRGEIIFGTEELDNLRTSVEAGHSVPCYLFFVVSEMSSTEHDSVSLLFGCGDFSEDIYAGNFGNPTINWEACSSMIRMELNLSE